MPISVSQGFGLSDKCFECKGLLFGKEVAYATQRFYPD